MSEELEKIMPSDFKINLLGKERQIKFGNLALAKIEKKYGSIEAFDKVQEDLEKKPMETIPWLLSICLRDKEGLTDDYESILAALDDSNVTLAEAVNTVMGAITSSLSIFSGQNKKEAPELPM